MKRNDFVFTIGYDGNTAIVDRKTQRKYRNAGAGELLNAGQYRPAFCAALFDDQLHDFVAEFRAATGIAVTDADAIKRLFGVFGVPDGVKKIMAVG